MSAEAEVLGLDELLVAIPTPRDLRVWRPNKAGTFTPTGQGVRFHSRGAIEAVHDALSLLLNRELDWSKEPESE